MTNDILAFGVFLVAATPNLKRKVGVEVHDQELGQRIVRRVIARAWQCRHCLPTGSDLTAWLLGLLDQEKEREILTACPVVSLDRMERSSTAA